MDTQGMFYFARRQTKGAALFYNLAHFAWLLLRSSKVNKTNLQALYLSVNFCHKTGTRPHSWITPQQPTIYLRYQILQLEIVFI